MTSMQRQSTASRGFSLVEFMVAMVLGLIIIGGAVSVYLASKRSLTEVEQVAAVSENGRFALQVLNYAAKHIGFYGSALPADIRLDGSLGAVGLNCTGNADAYDTDNSFFAVRATGPTVLGCITDAMPNTDVLVIKGVVPSPLYDANPDDPNAPRDGTISFPTGLDSETAYVISNSERGIILDGADTAPDVREGNEFALGVAWPYRMQIFYVRNNPTGPTLSRKVLAWDTGTASMTVQNEDLVQGVENMRFLFGFDSNADGDVDTIDDLEAVTTAGRWDSVTSMQAFVLLRSDNADPAYTNEKTYSLGDVTVTPGDDVRRVLLHTEITLRNPRLVLRGGA
ncbi:prepilin-type N-terminal cleavage/methylation domain-containing protein [Pseudohalioglobus sediminis]|uniref:Prepilin-type N-terminal cleavage/methylation domain-containing protein n=2 Tax=Pseudohalioglobus sediminis TaxID=2606449 RepID=A0A5B0WQ10_9GAMM|nr:prepilin-type N-terminal cleavage/methylation domain-containing protein [Pseudohalioglobus sediminis]